MKGITFDYPNTCPKIDKAMDIGKAALAQHIDSILEEACPLMSSSTRREHCERYTEAAFNDLSDVFETVREINSDLRDAAERQIADLHTEIADLESRVES